jgi:hypothetical protein
MDWHQLKEWLSGASGLDMDSLHVHAGVLCQIGLAVLLRRRLSSVLPWLAVAAVVLANEAYDFSYEEWPNRWQQLGESVRDVWNTLLLPSVILLLARYRPGLFGAAAAGGPSPADPGQAGAETGEAGGPADQPEQ